MPSRLHLYIACGDEALLQNLDWRGPGVTRWRLSPAVLLLAAMLGPGSLSARADEIRIAVASNFSRASEALAERFEQQSGHEVLLAFASTGKHYAQIRNGAPFDAFFAADEMRPRLLEEEGLAVPASRFTYALGTLVLWSRQADLVDSAGSVLEDGDFRFLAIANPKLAPYGRAAQEVLEKRGVWQNLQDRLVRGENIGQAYQFVASGNAELGFVALSQVESPGQVVQGSLWKIPPGLYSPIEQQAILVRDNSVARDFLAFVKSGEGRRLIRSNGYGTP